MKLKALFEDDGAVSPVIGVILMVAITVILAAVIGTFVLGLGQNVQSTAPQTSFEYQFDSSGDSDYTDQDDSVEITHDGGDSLDAARITVKVGGSDASGLSWGSSTAFSGDVGAGDVASYTEGSTSHLDPGTTVSVIWTSQSGDSTATLGKSEVPE